MERSCAYKFVLGRPGEGVHAPRIGGLAAVDLLGTLALIAVLSMWWNPVLVTVLVTVTFIFLHWLFCVPTALNEALGLAPSRVAT